MALKLYGIPNCNTMKKARTWLEDHNVAYEFHNYKIEGVTADHLRAWLEVIPNKKLFNKSSATYRALNEAERASLSDNEKAIKIAVASPSIIKRPVVERDGKALTVGFDIEEYNELFG